MLSLAKTIKFPPSPSDCGTDADRDDDDGVECLTRSGLVLLSAFFTPKFLIDSYWMRFELDYGNYLAIQVFCLNRIRFAMM